MILLTLFWTLYFALHSGLASLKVKAWVKIRLPQFFRYYRLFYNGFALASFILILTYQEKLAAYTIAKLPIWTLIIGYTFIAVGLIIISASFKNYDANEFLGVKPMNEFRSSASPLVISGLNAYVRHPIYSGILIALMGYLLVSFDYRTLAFTVISFIYILLGARLEERKLTILYGEHYLEYQKKVGMLIPFI